jgi:hypothetical protein
MSNKENGLNELEGFADLVNSGDILITSIDVNLPVWVQTEEESKSRRLPNLQIVYGFVEPRVTIEGTFKL